MSSSWSKVRVYNLMHKSVVSFCMAFTAVGTVFLGVKLSNYLLYTRPEMKRLYQLQKQEEMEKLQTERESELLRQQKEADTLRA